MSFAWFDNSCSIGLSVLGPALGPVLDPVLDPAPDPPFTWPDRVRYFAAAT